MGCQPTRPSWARCRRVNRQVNHGIDVHPVASLPGDRTPVTYATSTYPDPPEEIHLNMIPTLRACFVERQVTLDCAVLFSGHAASMEATGNGVVV